MKRLTKKIFSGSIKFSPRIVVKFHDDFHMPYDGQQEINDFLLDKNIISWNQMLKTYPGIRVNKLFTSLSKNDLLEMVTKAKNRNKLYAPPNFLTYFAIDFPDEKDKDKLLKEIWKDKNIEYAYKESMAYPPSAPATTGGTQGYLDTAPKGIDAKVAWDNGGSGNMSLKFIDLEQGWTLNHVGLPLTAAVAATPVTPAILPGPAIQVLSGDSVDHFGHGTAVLGIILARSNETGCVGIAPDITANVISQVEKLSDAGERVKGTNDNTVFVNNTSSAIAAATSLLNPGDVLLLETQLLLDTSRSATPKNYPPEIELAIFQSIQLAVQSGIIVIEPAANGSANLDKFKDDSGQLVLKRVPGNGAFKDSGAIMVASASTRVPHARDSSTNYGSRIDCYAWGSKIKTIGNLGNSQSSTDFTKNFNGTSGAAAIIAGAALSVQSMRESLGGPRFTPDEMRNMLALNGTASKTSSDMIGVMPDLSKIKTSI